MNMLKKLTTLVAALGLTALAAPAQTNVETFNFTNGLAVPDGNLSGLADAQMVTVLQPTWSIVDVNVTLELSGGFNGDLYAFLTHDSGFAVLLNRPGRTAGNLFGYGDGGFNITLDDGAANDIHNYQLIGGYATLIGDGSAWQPDGRNVHPLTALDVTGRSAFLDSFNFGSGSGMWTLFVADVGSGQQSVLEGWSLQITTTLIPEPSALALGVVGAVCLWRMMKRRRQS